MHFVPYFGPPAAMGKSGFPLDDFDDDRALDFWFDGDGGEMGKKVLKVDVDFRTDVIHAHCVRSRSLTFCSSSNLLRDSSTNVYDVIANQIPGYAVYVWGKNK